MAKTKIEWTMETWNPLTGCTKVSEGCKKCYAERMTKRLKGMKLEKYYHGFDTRMVHLKDMNYPFTLKKPTTIFVASMSDIFHIDFPDGVIKMILDVIRQTPQHTYLILTKRSIRLKEYSLKYDLKSLKNCFFGVSVENSKAVERVIDLCQTEVIHKFLSIEPLLEFIKPDLLELFLDSSVKTIGYKRSFSFKVENFTLTREKIEWVVLGGETGPGSKPIPKEWIVPILELCERFNIPFFFKQFGGSKKNNVLNGKIYEQLPERIKR